MLNDVFPLRVEAVPAAHTSEWRADDSFPPRQTQAWQLIYVCSGTIEERCDDRRVLLRAGGLLFHQPGEVFAMTTVGEVPPETLRIDFYCTGAAMDRFRGTILHAEPTEQHDLDWLANMLVSFVCAMQVQSFRKVHGNAYASTMCIGNMRSGMQYLYTGLHTKDRAVLRRAMQYFAVIALFAVGAAAGSLLTIHFGNRVIWFCCASLLVSLSFMFIREDIEENPELQREAAALHQDVKAMEHTIGKTLQEQQEELHPLNHK